MKDRPADTLHLTEEQLDEILMEIADAESVAHAAGCAVCGRRLADFRAAMATFNQATMAWSQARSNTMPLSQSTARPTGWWSRSSPWSYAGVSAILALAVAAGVHRHSVDTAEEIRTASASAASDYFSSRQQEIASDNAMLAAISTELYQPVTIPAAISGGRGIHAASAGEAQD